MSEIAKELTSHCILLVNAKAERGMYLATVLKKIGFKVIATTSLYEALKIVPQEMPHLIITESLLSDGNAGTLFDRLAAHKSLKKTPILVNIQKKTRAELESLSSRKFSGFFLGKPDPKQLVSKVMDVLSTFHHVSPYFCKAEALGIDPKMVLSMPATILGKNGEQVVSRSMVEFDPKAALVALPNDTELPPALFKLASNQKDEEGFTNFFPMNRIIGKGRAWLETLRAFASGSNSQAQIKEVLFYDPDAERFSQFYEVMTGFDIELVHAQNLSQAAAIVAQTPEEYPCVYLHELLNDSSAIEFKRAFEEIPEAKRPVMIVGTTSQNLRSNSFIRYLVRPFGLGVLVDMINSAFESSNFEPEEAGDNGIKINYQAAAQLIGIDETGGILQTKFPIIAGSSCQIDHPFLKDIWGEVKTVKILKTMQPDANSQCWQVRFDAVGVGMSKAKYWERISDAIAEKKSDAA